MRPDALKGHLEGLVLAVVAEGPSHGYAIMESLSEKTDGELEVEGGTLYPVLHRLEAEGLLSGKWSTAHGRRRRTYALTSKGKAALKQERSAWSDFVSAIDGVMTPAERAT